MDEKKRPFRLSDEQRHNAVILRDRGFDIDGIASILGVGYSTVRYTLRVYDYVKANELEKIKSDRALMKNVGSIEWACRECGIDSNKFLERLVNGEQESEQPKKEDKSSEASASDIEDAIHVATKLMTADIQKTIQEQGEILARKLDQIATIIQSCCKNQVDKNNANADIAVKEYQKMNESLSWIRSQTKNLRYVK